MTIAMETAIGGVEVLVVEAGQTAIESICLHSTHLVSFTTQLDQSNLYDINVELPRYFDS